MLTSHTTQEHVDPPDQLEEDYDPACGRSFGTDPKRHRDKVHGDGGSIGPILLKNTEWLFNIKPRGSHSQTVHEIAKSSCNSEVFPCFQLFNNFDHVTHSIKHGYQPPKISKRTHAESIAKAMQTHIVQKTELQLVYNTMSIRLDIEAHHVAYVERILQHVSPFKDLLTLRSHLSRRPELSHSFLRMFLRTRLQDELSFRLDAAQQPRFNITTTTHLISWKRRSDRSFSKKVDKTACTTKAIKIAVASYGMNAKSLDARAFICSYTAKHGLAIYDHGKISLQLRKEVQSAFTIQGSCPVLTILLHGFEALTASYSEFCVFADALQVLLPGTVIHLLVKQSEEWLFSNAAWTATNIT